MRSTTLVFGVAVLATLANAQCSGANMCCAMLAGSYTGPLAQFVQCVATGMIWYKPSFCLCNQAGGPLWQQQCNGGRKRDVEGGAIWAGKNFTMIEEPVLLEADRAGDMMIQEPNRIAQVAVRRPLLAESFEPSDPEIGECPGGGCNEGMCKQRRDSEQAGAFWGHNLNAVSAPIDNLYSYPVKIFDQNGKRVSKDGDCQNCKTWHVEIKTPPGVNQCGVYDGVFTNAKFDKFKNFNNMMLPGGFGCSTGNCPQPNVAKPFGRPGMTTQCRAAGAKELCEEWLKSWENKDIPKPGSKSFPAGHTLKITALSLPPPSDLTLCAFELCPNRDDKSNVVRNLPQASFVA